ncbi:AmmeMemoRadiSam system protein B [candidate division TA06 bacterium]|nr:AmmeMemoRadiSam system protein B [candidate division TA06 bacterium]
MNIRRSIIAGSWYPGEAAKLKAEVEKYLTAAQTYPTDSELLGIVAPHAGLMYSGPVAAYAYKNLKGLCIKTVVLIGPSHRAYFDGAAVYASGEWETPLGKVGIDAGLCQKIIGQDQTHINDLPAAHAQEHSLEIQLPFLQTVLEPGFRIVPIMMSDHSLSSCERLAHSIVRAVKGDDGVMLLASSDLSHFHSQAEARKLDQKVARAIENYDPEKLAGELAFEKCEACGGGPIVAVMIACKLLGADKGVVYDYRTSGDITGEKEQVVGYLAAGLYRTK